MDLFNYTRRASSEVLIGGTPLGGDNPIRVQSMTTTATTDTEGSVAQAKRIVRLQDGRIIEDRLNRPQGKEGAAWTP